MTRPRPIRMNPARLPELTPAQKARVKAIRSDNKEHRVGVQRKGQPDGCICVTVEHPRGKAKLFYDQDGEPITWHYEPRLDGQLGLESADPDNALFL